MINSMMKKRGIQNELSVGKWMNPLYQSLLITFRRSSRLLWE